MFTGLTTEMGLSYGDPFVVFRPIRSHSTGTSSS